MFPTGGSFRPITLPLKLPGPEELAALPKGAVVLLHGGVLDRNLDTSYLKLKSSDLRWSGDIPPAYPTGGTIDSVLRLRDLDFFNRLSSLLDTNRVCLKT